MNIPLIINPHEKVYTVNSNKNNQLAERYRELAKREPNIIFGGRLAGYKYYDMDDVIKSAMDAARGELDVVVQR